ncbi:thioredoxin family protein [Thiohalomonas denitrificans]|uniref:Thioredoxin-related protein n=1 Tax=Thiohalomonas denitrificans TaxID=415747 RepID=A0A1G5QLZ7_9GAMM|nr:Thioredoxin-related protein [Thiohalomonas denitrificans]
MRRLMPVFVLLWGLVGPTYAAGERDPYQYFFNETFGDFTEELQLAKDQGKQGILLFFEMDECPFCHWMKDHVLNRADVQEYYRENFLSFPVDIEGEIEITSFSGEPMTQKDFAFKKHRVRATPVFAFFDLEGERIHRFTGRTRDSEEFMLLGRYVAEGHYHETSFTRFKRQQR